MKVISGVHNPFKVRYMADPFKAKQEKLSLSLALPLGTLDIKSQYFNITLCCLWCPIDTLILDFV